MVTGMKCINVMSSDFMSKECCFYESQTENKPRESNVSKQVKKIQDNIHRHRSVI